MRRKWTDLWWAVFLLAGVALVGRLGTWSGSSNRPPPAIEVTVGHVRPGMSRVEVENTCGPYMRIRMSEGSELADYTSDRFKISVTYVHQRVVRVEGPHCEISGRVDDVAALGPPAQSMGGTGPSGDMDLTTWTHFGLSRTCSNGNCSYELRLTDLNR